MMSSFINEKVSNMDEKTFSFFILLNTKCFEYGYTILKKNIIIVFRANISSIDVAINATSSGYFSVRGC